MFFFLVLLHHYTAKCEKVEKVEIEALEKVYNFNFANTWTRIASTAPTAPPATPTTLRYYPHSVYPMLNRKENKTEKRREEDPNKKACTSS